jgi:hypothetical protein
MAHSNFEGNVLKNKEKVNEWCPLTQSWEKDVQGIGIWQQDTFHQIKFGHIQLTQEQILNMLLDKNEQN